ncbi:MAG: hypothetical protein K6G40_01785 [Eubacterium sp.]|nr:hypothetical protein [Eubacterium sp.]
MIGGIGFSSYNSYSSMIGSAENSSAMSKYAVTSEKEAVDAGMSDAEIRGLKRTGRIECQQCASRKYQDGSDENVSFKSAAHISPNAAGAAVRAHEGEHVTNAYEKAAEGNGRVLRASVAIHTAICPECGRSYVSGGTTSTAISYNEDTPYGTNAKNADAASGLIGSNFDMAV